MFSYGKSGCNIYWFVFINVLVMLLSEYFDMFFVLIVVIFYIFLFSVLYVGNRFV